MRDDICAGCGKPLVARPDGSRLRCCGRGYCSDMAPLPRDSWWPMKKKYGRHLYEKRERI